jgi:Transglycosylase SLT domain
LPTTAGARIGFAPQLFDALRLIQRGDLRPQEMIGSWAGELGQTQMMPSEYYQYAVDYDGDGARNLLRSAPDVLASTANYLVGLGWRRGEPWLTEVRMPATLSWQQADLDIKLPRAKWSAYGVTLADGRPLPADDLPASLLLPMGRFGPALLAYDNFRVYLQWNNALVYSPRPLILPLALPARRRFTAAMRRRPWLLATSRRCKRAWRCRVRCRRDRWISRLEDPAGGQGDAGEIQPARGFLSHRRAFGAHAGRPLMHAASKSHFGEKAMRKE